MSQTPNEDNAKIQVELVEEKQDKKNLTRRELRVTKPDGNI